MKLAKSFYKKHPSLAITLVVVLGIQLLYAPAAKAHFTDDSWELITDWQRYGWQGFRQNFGYNGLYSVYHFIYFSLYLLLGTHWLSWHILLTGFYAVNIVLVWHWIKQYLQTLSSARFMATASVLLLLTSPYHSEPVVWSAAIHYQVLLFIFIVGSIYFIPKQEKLGLSDTGLWILLYSLACFTQETAWVFPAAWFLLYVFYGGRPPLKKDLKKGFTHILIPQMGVLVIYFILLWYHKGVLIPHYGAEAHTAYLSPAALASHIGGYFFKWLLLGQYWPAYYREKAFALILAYSWIPIIIVGLPLLVQYLMRSVFGKTQNKTGLWVMLACLFLLPVLSLYFFHLHPIETDRFLLLASVFMALLMAEKLSLVQGKLKWGLLIIWVVLQSFLLIKNNVSWQQAARIQEATAALVAQNTQRPLALINMPVNYKGAYIFRNNNKLRRYLRTQGLYDSLSAPIILSGTQLENDHSGVEIAWLDSTSLRVVAQGGSWFWDNGRGAMDKNTPEYDRDVEGWYCDLDFKGEAYRHWRLYYFQNQDWKELSPYPHRKAEP